MYQELLSKLPAWRLEDPYVTTVIVMERNSLSEG